MKGGFLTEQDVLKTTEEEKTPWVIRPSRLIHTYNNNNDKKNNFIKVTHLGLKLNQK